MQKFRLRRRSTREREREGREREKGGKVHIACFIIFESRPIVDRHGAYSTRSTTFRASTRQKANTICVYICMVHSTTMIERHMHVYHHKQSNMGRSPSMLRSPLTPYAWNRTHTHCHASESVTSFFQHPVDCYGKNLSRIEIQHLFSFCCSNN